jgi:hypothetical protein
VLGGHRLELMPFSQPDSGWHASRTCVKSRWDLFVEDGSGIAFLIGQKERAF